MCDLTQDELSSLRDGVFDYSAIVRGNIQEFERFNDYFYKPTFSIIARFSALKDAEIIGLLTEITFLRIWINKHLLLEERPGAVIFQTTMRVTLRYLSNRDQHERVRAIEGILGQEYILQALNKNVQNDKPTPTT